MLFNSITFLKFFAVVYALYLVLTHKWQNRLLLVASLIFYGYWDWRYLFLMLASIWFAYYMGVKIEDTPQPKKKRVLQFTLFVLLGVLILFKYTMFFWSNVVEVGNFMGMSVPSLAFNIILPLGISFYTFQAIGYLMDVYWGDLKASRSLEEFALFKTFFPQLIAGPIERGDKLLPQVTNERKIVPSQVGHGVYLFAWGLFKKVAIADNVAVITNTVFADYQGLSALEIWTGVIAFTIQIYGDFSGYSDMARGMAKMMGFELVINFKLPFFATNPADFWNRWHISLSNWFRSYVYYPVFSKTRSASLAIITTFVLNGVWHGAGWNFVFLGLYWGLMVSGYNFIQPWIKKATSDIQGVSANALKFLSVLLMFQFTCFGFFLFRVDSGAKLVGMATKLFTDSWAVTPLAGKNLVTLGFHMLILLCMQIPQYFTKDLDIFMKLGRFPRFATAVVAIYLFALIYLFGENSLKVANDFIYFQF